MFASGPPITVAYPPAPEPTTAGRRRAALRRASGPLAALAVAAAVGMAVGASVYAVLSAVGDDSDGWAELGYLVAGAAAGLLASCVAYVAALIAAAARTFPRGERATPVSLALGLPLALAAFGGALTWVFPDQVVGVIAVIPAGAALLAGPAAFAWSGDRTGVRRVLVALVAVVAASVAAAAALAGAAEARTARIVEDMPLVLFDGRSAEAPFELWRRDAFTSTHIRPASGFAASGHQAYLKYMAPGGVTFVTMHTDVGDCSDTSDYTCDAEGELDGRELRRYTRVAGYGSYPRSDQFLVAVFPGGGGVSVNVGPTRGGAVPGARGAMDPRSVLDRLVAVERDTFEDATGAPLVTW